MNTFIKTTKSIGSRIAGASVCFWNSYRAHLPWCLGLLAIVLSIFGWNLFSKTTVYSQPGTDIYAQYIYQQSFIHMEATRDYPVGPVWKEMPPFNLPLWNPYTYGGHSFVGDSQSAIFYPLTWMVARFTPATALNLLMAFHTFLIGFGLYAWAAWRGLRPFAAFVGGVIAMLGGVYYMHVYAGHMSNLGSMAWTPFVFLGIDAWMRTHRVKWVVLAAAAAALQVYAGHAQYVYYTAIVAGLYSLLFLWKAERRCATILGLLAIYPLAVTFAAVQLLPSYGSMMESVRAGGTNIDFAKMFGLPPENLLTYIAPWFYGGTDSVPYWGRCYLWEMQLYVGVAGLALAAFGLGGQRKGERWRWGALLAAVVILAFGANVPALYKILYNIVPFYSSFRGASKFMFFAGLLGALLAAMGLNRLLNKEKPAVSWGGAFAALGAVCVIFGFMFASKSMSGAWQSISAWMLRSGESYLPADIWTTQPAVTSAALALSGSSLLIGGGLLVVAGLLLIAARKLPQAAWALGAMVAVELYVFAQINTKSFSIADIHGGQVQGFLEKNKGDYRTLNLIAPISGMAWRSEGVWGNEPSVLKRYAEFITFTQGGNPDHANQYVNFSRVDSRLFGMLRARVAFEPDGRNIKVTPLVQDKDAFGRFYIVSSYEVIKSRDAIFKRLADPTFDLKQQVILEKEPNPQPEQAAVEYTVRLLGQTNDQWTLEVICNRATMLVMTDAWSRDWRAVTLPGSVQTNYEVIPANYILRAIPLAQGRHVLRIEYAPWGLSTGKRITFASIIFFGLLLAFPSWRRKLRLETDESAA